MTHEYGYVIREVNVIQSTRMFFNGLIHNNNVDEMSTSFLLSSTDPLKDYSMVHLRGLDPSLGSDHYVK